MKGDFFIGALPITSLPAPSIATSCSRTGDVPSCLLHPMPTAYSFVFQSRKTMTNPGFAQSRQTTLRKLRRERMTCRERGTRIVCQVRPQRGCIPGMLAKWGVIGVYSSLNQVQCRRCDDRVGQGEVSDSERDLPGSGGDVF